MTYGTVGPKRTDAETPVVRAIVSPDTFRRKPSIRRERYVAPVMPEPEVRSTSVDYTVLRTKAGKIKGVEAERVLPSGAKTMITTIVDLPGWGLHVRYARGHAMGRDGGPARTNIMAPTGGTTPSGRPEMKAVDSTVNPPVESILVRAYAENEYGLIVFGGWWVNGHFDIGAIYVAPNWRRTAVGWQRGKSTPAEIPTLSEWVAQAETMPVKPSAPLWTAENVRRLLRKPSA